MRINEIDLSDWCQIERRYINCFGHNLIGLIGSNGTGKSNALAAIQFLITGEVDDKLEEYVRYTASSTSVKMSFEVDTTFVEVRRGITAEGKSEAWMNLRDERYGVDETFTKTSDVNGALEKLLNIDRDLARNNVFVKQKHLDDILFTTPAKRERAWQRLCGLGDAEKIHTYLGTVLSEIPEISDYTPQILECKENIEKLEKNLLGRAGESDKLKETLEQKGSSAQIIQVQTKLRECSMARKKLPTLKERSEKASAELEVSNKELTDANARLHELARLQECDEAVLESVLLGRLDTVDNILRTLAEAESLTKSMQESAESIAEAKLALEALKGEDMSQVEEAVKGLEEKVEEIRRQQALSQANVEMYESLKSSVNDADVETPECPLCGSEVPNKQWLVERCDGIIKTHRETVDELFVEFSHNQELVKEGKGIVNSHAVRIANMELSIASSESEYERQRLRVESLNVSDFNRDTVSETRVELQNHLDEVKKLRHTTQTLVTSITRLNTVKHEADSDYEDLKKVAESYGEDVDPDSQVAALDVVYQEVLALERKFNELEGANAADQDNLRNWKTSLERMEKMTMTGTVDCKVRRSVERIREWFHYSNGPHKVTMAVLNELTGGVNEFLSILDGRFYVVPDQENLMFCVVFTDGREQPEEPIPATRLSGGEKASLAVAFRLASYYMFSGSLGIICLDEPTEYLDARKIEAFGRFVEKLKEISNSLGLQIFMATHRTNIIPLFDTVERMDAPA